MDASPTTQSPFLPGTNIQFARIEERAKDLISKAIKVGNCWECHLARNYKGYCCASVGRALKMGAHKIVLFVIEPINDPELLALHECDNRSCIRPDHLFWGTAQDNTDDMIAKGRKVDDPTVGKRRREATAARIRPLWEQGLSNAEISARLNLSHTTVWTYTVAFSSGNECAVCLE